MKSRIACIALVLVLAGCSASLKFVDRTNGNAYQGSTGGTAGHSGTVTAIIEGETYSGEWTYSPNGGGYTLTTGTATAIGPSGATAATGTATGVIMPVQGDGLITMKAESGSYVRCVFRFNTMSNSGLGECQRNDGRQFDMTLKR